MAKNEIKPEGNADWKALNKKLDGILAILLRHLNDEGLGKWKNQDKPNIVKMLIDLEFDNDAIRRVVGLTYGSVANIRSGYKKRKKKKLRKAKK